MNRLDMISRCVLFVSVSALSACATTSPQTAPSPAPRPFFATQSQQFQFPLVSGYSADPFIATYNGNYYMVYTKGNNQEVRIRKAPSLAAMANSTTDVVMWAANSDPVNSPCCNIGSGGYLLQRDGRWYYYNQGNTTGSVNDDFSFVLESAGLDPLGPYTWKARFTGPGPGGRGYANAPLVINGNLYLSITASIGAGGNAVFLASMSNPYTLSSPWVRIAAPTQPWECANNRCIDEGSSVIERNGKVYLVFSAGGYESPDYCVGMLTANVSANVLDAASWTKSPDCVFKRNDPNQAYGPASMTFFSSPDGTETWFAYHIKTTTPLTFGGEDRRICAKKLLWNPDNTPNFGTPDALDTYHPVPAGDPGSAVFEAEQGNLSNAQTRSSVYASNGQYVGGLDFAHSSVTISGINAPAAGIYPINIYYANNTTSSSSHNLSVNGASPTPVNYLATSAWGRFSTANVVTVWVPLNAGANSLQLSKGNGFAELDKLELTYRNNYEAEDSSSIQGGFAQTFEAEQGSISNANIRSSGSASNGQYVGGLDFGDSAVTVTATVPSAATYTLQVRYANGSSVAASHALSVNNAAAISVNYPVTGAWGQFGGTNTVSLNIALPAGSNTLRFGKSSNFAELDRIQITGATQANAVTTVTNAEVRSNSAASGGGFVGGIDFANSSVQFNTVSVPSAGSYKLYVHYANDTGATSSYNLSINGNAATALSLLANGAWGLFDRKAPIRLEVSLQAGTNTLKFSKGTGFAELDRIVVIQ
jgi:GH43 family beta-xylosidase